MISALPSLPSTVFTKTLNFKSVGATEHVWALDVPIVNSLMNASATFPICLSVIYSSEIPAALFLTFSAPISSGVRNFITVSA